jgi:hypothetical protein
LVAGCGATTRIGFASHPRAATPIDVSVYVGAGGIALDPTKLSPGPVEFNVTNQSGRAVTVAVMLAGGRSLIRGAPIPAGGTAQLKATLSHHRFAVGFAGQPASARFLTLSGPDRTGANELTQP